MFNMRWFGVVGVLAGMIAAVAVFMAATGDVGDQAVAVPKQGFDVGAPGRLAPERVTMQIPPTPATGPIYSEVEALARALSSWPPYLVPTNEIARLMTYGQFKVWLFGPKAAGATRTEPVWVVARTADNATLDDYGFDGENTPVVGFWYQFQACNGRSEMFGGLTTERFNSLFALPNTPLSITPCAAPTVVPTVTTPW